MKQFLLSIGIIFLAFQSIKGQPVHYFEFITTCGHGNWQDTSFIAATSDQAVIDTCLVDLNKPLVYFGHCFSWQCGIQSQRIALVPMAFYSESMEPC